MTFTIKPEAIQRYVVRRQKDLEVLQQAYQSEDYAKIFEIAHQLKGNAAMFGFSELGEHAEVLESSAHTQDAPIVGKEIDWIRSWLSKELEVRGGDLGARP